MEEVEQEPSSKQTLTAFHLFTNLPDDLKVKIIHWLLHDERLLTLRGLGEEDKEQALIDAWYEHEWIRNIDIQLVHDAMKNFSSLAKVSKSFRQLMNGEKIKLQGYKGLTKQICILKKKQDHADRVFEEKKNSKEEFEGFFFDKFVSLIQGITLLENDMIDVHLNNQSLKLVPQQIFSSNFAGRIKELSFSYLHRGPSNRVNLIRIIPSTIKLLENIEEIDMRCCHVKGIPPQLLELKKLKRLDLTGSAISELPAWMEQLVSLQWFAIEINGTQPPNIHFPKNLKYLDFKAPFKEVPQNLWKLSQLESLSLSVHNATELSSDVSQLKKLKKIMIHWSAITTLIDEDGKALPWFDSIFSLEQLNTFVLCFSTNLDQDSLFLKFLEELKTQKTDLNYEYYEGKIAKISFCRSPNDL